MKTVKPQPPFDLKEIEMARDPRTLSRMLSRGEPPQTLEDMWMVIKRLSYWVGEADGKANMALNILRAIQEEDEEEAHKSQRKHVV